MKIEHIALWTKQLEVLRQFYTNYFNATSNRKYINATKGFESYFLSFDSGCRLEIMSMTSTIESTNESSPSVGYAHFAVSTGDQDTVIALTEKLKKDGYKILSEPRTTGDGYFESVVLDPDGNQVEITV